MRGGRYELKQPVRLTPKDSGVYAEDKPHAAIWPIKPLTITAYPGEEPILSGGKRISRWKQIQVNDTDAWITDLPEVRNGNWSFSQLWVDGQRAQRPKFPEIGRFRIEKLLGKVVWGNEEVHDQLFTGQDRFRYGKGELQRLHNEQDIDFVALHFWIESRIPIKQINPRTREVTLKHKSKMRLTDDFGHLGAEYYLENIFEALKEPGQWYLDRPAGKLYYIPLPGQDPETTEVIAPVLDELLRVEGDWHKGRAVERIHINGLTFQHNEWQDARKPAIKATPQAASHVPAAITILNGRDIRFENCRMNHLGTYAAETNNGCSEVTFSQCTMHDLGAGGVFISHTPMDHFIPGKGQVMPE